MKNWAGRAGVRHVLTALRVGMKGYLHGTCSWETYFRVLHRIRKLDLGGKGDFSLVP